MKSSLWSRATRVQTAIAEQERRYHDACAGAKEKLLERLEKLRQAHPERAEAFAQLSKQEQEAHRARLYAMLRERLAR